MVYGLRSPVYGRRSPVDGCQSTTVDGRHPPDRTGDGRLETEDYTIWMHVGLVGWRGMVGSVLTQRMREERDFDLIDPVFFSTSQVGVAAPSIGKPAPAV